MKEVLISSILGQTEKTFNAIRRDTRAGTLRHMQQSILYGQANEEEEGKKRPESAFLFRFYSFFFCSFFFFCCLLLCPSNYFTSKLKLKFWAREVDSEKNLPRGENKRLVFKKKEKKIYLYIYIKRMKKKKNWTVADQNMRLWKEKKESSCDCLTKSRSFGCVWLI